MFLQLHTLYQRYQQGKRNVFSPSMQIVLPEEGYGGVERETRGSGIKMPYLIYLLYCRKRRQPAKNVTKAAPAELSTPQRLTREEILRDSPGRVTRSKLALLLGEGTSSQTDTTSPVRITTAAPPKKMTPKRKLHIE